MTAILDSIVRSQRYVSVQNGILKYIVRADRMNDDPRIISYGINPGNTTLLGGKKYLGQSSGCNYDKYNAYLSTIGETIERYCPAFYDISKMRKSSYSNRDFTAIAPSSFAMFHPKQERILAEGHFPITPFKDDTVVYWTLCTDLTTGEKVYCPSSFIYLPWSSDDKPILYASSTGLAAHTNRNKALITCLYEIIERDSFVLTWFQKIVPSKIIIDRDIRTFLDKNVPGKYEWNFFDITYDLGVPTVYGICCGEADYGPFIAVSTATRSTLGDAIRKVILEIQQTIPYFRYELNVYKNWEPSDNFNEIMDFRQHSIFYLKRPEYQEVFNPWRKALATKKIDFNETNHKTDKELISSVLSIMRRRGYNVLFKDLTTIDARQGGFYCFRVVIPQLLPLIGAYPYYLLGGERLYSVPKKLGYETNDFEHLNQLPHPFP